MGDIETPAERAARGTLTRAQHRSIMAQLDAQVGTGTGEIPRMRETRDLWIAQQVAAGMPEAAAIERGTRYAQGHDEHVRVGSRPAPRPGRH